MTSPHVSRDEWIAFFAWVGKQDIPAYSRGLLLLAERVLVENGGEPVRHVAIGWQHSDMLCDLAVEVAHDLRETFVQERRERITKEWITKFDDAADALESSIQEHPQEIEHSSKRRLLLAQRDALRGMADSLRDQLQEGKTQGGQPNEEAT